MTRLAAIAVLVLCGLAALWLASLFGWDRLGDGLRPAHRRLLDAEFGL